ncbi:MAG: T9SS type A sorting domain-containing protein, partial [Bacteroidales bacterium]|nr:T9SS type A sorting domain-containing protein [Bacteroidales bacterium]
VNGNMNLSIYPNPTSDATTIALSGVNGEVQIVIVDMNGRTVMSDSMSCEGDCTKRMEVSGLAQGAYFVRVSGEGVNQVKKLVVK